MVDVNTNVFMNVNVCVQRGQKEEEEKREGLRGEEEVKRRRS